MASKYEKMETLLEDIMKETNIDGKIQEMENELNSTPQVGGKDRAEYRKNVQEQKQKNKEIEKKLNFYKSFKENKDQIFNIREYQLELQKNLEVLQEENKEIDRKVKEYDNNEKQIKDLDDKLDKIQEQIEKIDETLKVAELSEEDKAELQSKKKSLKVKMDDQNVSYQFALRKKLEFQNLGILDAKVKKDEISNNIKGTEVQISKCNAIWSSLLKGKNWDDIKVLLETGDFTAKKGTIDKIKDLKQSNQKLQQENSIDKQNKSVKKSVNNIINKINSKQNNMEKEENNGAEIAENEQNLPIKVESFADRHSILGKIPFLGKIIDKINKNKRDNNIKKDPEKVADDKNITSVENNNSGISDKDLKYISQEMKKSEFETFKRIAENGPRGFRESMKTETQEKYNKMQQEAAERYANKHRGKYIQQAEEMQQNNEENDGPEI